jgi:hypothetical protein
MTKEQIIKLYIADLNNLVADSDAKINRIMDLEDELEALKQGQSLLIGSVIAIDDFRKELQDAIESGRDTDYCWNREDVVAVDTFDEGYALSEVIKVLEKHLL